MRGYFVYDRAIFHQFRYSLNMPRRRRKPVPTDIFHTTITGFSHEGRGIAKINGKTTFIDGALLGEAVSFQYTQCRGQYDEGVVTSIDQANPHRQEPRCAHTAVCGGCRLQHLQKCTTG